MFWRNISVGYFLNIFISQKIYWQFLNIMKYKPQSLPLKNLLEEKAHELVNSQKRFTVTSVQIFLLSPDLKTGKQASFHSFTFGSKHGSTNRTPLFSTQYSLVPLQELSPHHTRYVTKFHKGQNYQYIMIYILFDSY